MAEHQIPTPELPAAIVSPGIIIRTSVNLGEQDRLIQFETFCDRDESENEINHRCDVMMRAADRQRAKHLLPSYKRNREDVEYKTNDNKARLAELEARLKAMNDARSEKVLELQKEMGDAIGRARDEHVDSGRRGAFKAPGALTSRFQTQIDQVLDAGVKEHNEAATQRSVLENEIKEGQRGLEKWDVLIREQEALASEAANER